MFIYKDPLDTNRNSNAMEIVRLTRLLGEAYVNTANLLEVLAATEAKAESLAARLDEANDVDEDEREATQRNISELRQECDGLRLRAKTAEEAAEYQTKRANALVEQVDTWRRNMELTATATTGRTALLGRTPDNLRDIIMEEVANLRKHITAQEVTRDQ